MSREDVLIVGAGPAGSVAALLLARAGAMVRLLERSEGPRDKLCGDSLNPGAVDLLRRLGLAREIERHGLPITGMVVTGPGGAVVDGAYPAGVAGRTLKRREFDQFLLEEAVRAGARVETGVTVKGPVGWSGDGPRRVTGVALRTKSGADERRFAPIVIAADGRRSACAVALGLSRQPASPRRWAVGAYFEGVRGLTARGEMHLRFGHYIGVAPLPGGLANACLVCSGGSPAHDLSRPGEALERALRRDPLLAERFQGAVRVGDVRVLGPLAVDAETAGAPGLLLAGDAAGFVDPMTGDGLHVALEGAELAADAALRGLGGGLDAPHEWLTARRRETLGAKLRVNRWLRRLVGSRVALAGATALAELFPSFVQRLVHYAGDVAPHQTR